MFDLSKKLWQWLAMLFLALIWGSSFILMKKGLLAFSFLQVAAIRVFFAFIVLIPVIVKHFSKLNKNNIKSIAIVGYAGIFFPAFLFALAQTHISSALSGMLNSTATLFTLVVGIVFYRNKPSANQYFGIIIGFLGALALITGGDFSSIFGVNAYALFIILATFGYGINANEVRFGLKNLNGIQITTLSFLLVGPTAGIILFTTDLSASFHSPYFTQSLLAVLALSTFGSVISLFVYNSLIHSTSALFATSVTYIIPIFAIIWGIFDGETINIIQFLGIIIVLIGVYLVNIRRNK
ncbi:MAG TPA: DMT family transporter [Tenuifilaceae bacterium]|nr:DMT family transporter [Tenuifilaceae bacterium]HPE18036.1 DMT family transporter [Tenuifilaceae bacterium]HPJ44601.1 DMT family transporter [Tenuifilaceae bacterium]HPQ34447.1 DMT family transporter [Tenuifilaceae bacterium]HRX68914.1 DMT family transporter [Tenuifilaceae bacterium]